MKRKKIMEKFRNLIELFNALDVYFIQIAENEIVVPNPLDIGINTEKRNIIEIIKDESTEIIKDDDCYIHIKYNKNYDNLDWLTTINKN